MDTIRVTLTTTNPTLKHKVLALADYDNATKLNEAIRDWITWVFPKYQNIKPDPKIPFVQWCSMHFPDLRIKVRVSPYRQKRESSKTLGSCELTLEELFNSAVLSNTITDAITKFRKEM